MTVRITVCSRDPQFYPCSPARANFLRGFNPTTPQQCTYQTQFITSMRPSLIIARITTRSPTQQHLLYSVWSLTLYCLPCTHSHCHDHYASKYISFYHTNKNSGSLSEPSRNTSAFPTPRSSLETRQHCLFRRLLLTHTLIHPSLTEPRG